MLPSLPASPAPPPTTTSYVRARARAHTHLERCPPCQAICCLRLRRACSTVQRLRFPFARLGAHQSTACMPHTQSSHSPNNVQLQVELVCAVSDIIKLEAMGAACFVRELVAGVCVCVWRGGGMCVHACDDAPRLHMPPWLSAPLTCAHTGPHTHIHTHVGCTHSHTQHRLAALGTVWSCEGVPASHTV